MTIFASAKPLHGHTGVIQRNAISSWTRLHPRPEIILFGDDHGVAEVCREFSLRHIPQLAMTEFGAPLLSNLFEQAQRIASHDILCYVNSDIMLMGDFLEALRTVSKAQNRFLMVGRRWDVSIRDIWDFGCRGGENGLREFVTLHGKQAPPPGNSDYFAFTRGLWASIPPFALGRGAWDPWMIYEARRLRALVVDASPAVMTIHQTHDQSTYRHGLRRWRQEVNRNWEIVGKEAERFCLWDSTHVLTPTGLRPVRGIRYFIRRADTLHLFHPRLSAPLKIVRLAAAGVRSLREKRALAREPLLRLVKLVQSKLPADGITAILGLVGGIGPKKTGDSPGLRLANSLTWRGMPVVIYDPEPAVMEHAQRSLGGPVKFAASAEECVIDADVVVLAVSKEEFHRIPAEALAHERGPRLVIDCCDSLSTEPMLQGIQHITWVQES